MAPTLPGSCGASRATQHSSSPGCTVARGCQRWRTTAARSWGCWRDERLCITAGVTSSRGTPRSTSRESRSWAKSLVNRSGATISDSISLPPANGLGHEPNALGKEQAAAAALLARGELADLHDPRIAGAGDQGAGELLRHGWSLVPRPLPSPPPSRRTGGESTGRGVRPGRPQGTPLQGWRGHGSPHPSPPPLRRGREHVIAAGGGVGGASGLTTCWGWPAM